MTASSGIPNNAKANKRRIPKTHRTKAAANAAATSASAAITNAKIREAKPKIANKIPITASATMAASNKQTSSIRRIAAQSN